MERKNVRTAGIIVVGDEILKSHVQDTNSHYLAHQLWLLGVKVCRISVVPDDVDTISEEVKRFSPLFDFVLTAGGVGPTHDDMTVEAVGKAFGEEFALNAELATLHFGGVDRVDPSNPWSRTLVVPKSTVVHARMDGEGKRVMPLLAIHNVHCYPGVPSLVRQIFTVCKDLYGDGCTRFYLKEVFVGCDETPLAKPLEIVQKEFSSSVQIGSYPSDVDSTVYRVKVTLESVCRNDVEKAYSKLFLQLLDSKIVSVANHYGQEDRGLERVKEELSWLISKVPPEKVSLVSEDLYPKLHTSVAVMEKALQDYRLEETCVAFNGGKDCTVILALFHALLLKLNADLLSSKMKVLYVCPPDPFTEVEQFISQTEKRYPISVIRVTGTIFEALANLKTTHPEIKAILMGTRRTDPHAEHLTEFSPTDVSWPSYMRVNCILDWSYHHVWQFLKLFRIHYCKLYDQGYTSLDGRNGTQRNPALAVQGTGGEGGAQPRFLPAHMLSDGALERAGRN